MNGAPLSARATQLNVSPLVCGTSVRPLTTRLCRRMKSRPALVQIEVQISTRWKLLAAARCSPVLPVASANVYDTRAL